jgi:hypothetical protein
LFIQNAAEASVKRTPRIQRVDVVYDGLTVWLEFRWEADDVYAPTRVPVSHGGIVSVWKRRGGDERTRFCCSISRKMLRAPLVLALHDTEEFKYVYIPEDDALFKPRFTLVSRQASPVPAAAAAMPGDRQDMEDEVMEIVDNDE